MTRISGVVEMTNKAAVNTYAYQWRFCRRFDKLVCRCLNYMYSVKQSNYSMRQSVKLVQSQRKTTTAGLKTVSYFGAKLWNDNVVLCNELSNEDFLTFKRTVNDPNLDIITHDDFQYLWSLTSSPPMHISFLAFYCFLPLWLSTSFNICFLWMNYEGFYETISATFHWISYI